MPGVTAKNSEEIPRSANLLQPSLLLGKSCPDRCERAQPRVLGLFKEKRGKSPGGDRGSPGAESQQHLRGSAPPTSPAAPGALSRLDVGKLRHGNISLRAAPPCSPITRSGVTQQSHMED